MVVDCSGYDLFVGTLWSFSTPPFSGRCQEVHQPTNQPAPFRWTERLLLQVVRGHKKDL